jgi:hypothetical protein
MPNFCSSSNPAKPILVRLSVIRSLKKHPHSYPKIDFMNEFLLLVIVIIYLAINPLYSKPKKNYFIANRKIE